MIKKIAVIENHYMCYDIPHRVKSQPILLKIFLRNKLPKQRASAPVILDWSLALILDGVQQSTC